MPVVCTVAFAAKRQVASGAVALFWTGQSLADGGVYVADGKAMALPAGRLTFGLGVVTMLAAVAVLALDLWASCYASPVPRESA